MLKREEAAKRLNEFRSPEYVRERIARLAGLPASLRDDARILFGLNESDAPATHWNRYWRLYQERQRKLLEACRAIDDGKLREMLETMAPSLAPYVLKAVSNVGRFPYTRGFGRRPFRSRSLPRLLDESRASLLSVLLTAIADYPPDIEWIATWAPHAWPSTYGPIGQLLAAAIDLDDERGRRVFDILIASAKGEHEIGQMGGHVIAALLMSGRVEGWEFIEKLLPAAQREEGMRQTVLELIDESHPDVFPRFVRLILEQDLVRFSATVRAVDVWFGFLWDAMSTGKAKQILEHTLRFLDDPSAADAAVTKARELPAVTAKSEGKKTPNADEAVEPAYIALWTKAFTDVASCIEPAERLLQSADSDARFVTAHLLCETQLVGRVSKSVADCLSDPEERVASRALFHFAPLRRNDSKQIAKAVPDLFERLERVLDRAPAKTTKLAPIVWPWMRLPWGKQVVAAALLNAPGDRPPSVLLPHLRHFDVRTRVGFIQRLAKIESPDAAARDALLSLVGDPSPTVRQAAVEQLKKCAVDETEARRLEGLLTRKASDLRRAILRLLLNQPDAQSLAAADRLVKSADRLQRLAGLELFREMVAADRMADECRRRAAEYEGGGEGLSVRESTHLTALGEPAAQAVTRDNCLGLIDPSARTPPLEPSPKEVRFFTPATTELLKALDALVHENREKPFVPTNHAGEAQEAILLGNAQPYQLPHPDPRKPISEQIESFPLHDVFFNWFPDRPASMRDSDGLELMRARWRMRARMDHPLGHAPPDWLKPVENLFLGGQDAPTSTLSAAVGILINWLSGFQRPSTAESEIRYPLIVGVILHWLVALYPCENSPGFLLDGLEAALAALPKDRLAETVETQFPRGRQVIWRTQARTLHNWLTCVKRPGTFQTAGDKTRCYRLLRWIDEPGVPVARMRPEFHILLDAFQVGGANEADLYDCFLGPPNEVGHHVRGSDLGHFTGLKPRQELLDCPALKEIVDRCRRRVLDVELARGETATCVSRIALSLRHTGGLEILIPFLRAAEQDTFTRGHSRDSESRPVVFSHIIRATYPAECDSPEKFAAAVEEAGVSQRRLLELAVYAPQWAAHVEHALQWPKLADAAWWIHAHTRDRDWRLDADLREKWKAQVALRTPLDSEDLLDGAVDVAWFHRTHAELGPERWNAVYDVAKYAGTGGGHKRAQLFADAMLGKLAVEEIASRIETKRNQDSVRALGLLPLPKTDGKTQVLSRYRTIQEFVRTSRQFGSMRQASEKRAAAIGMENLARTSGYPDPVRLQWAMEAESCADLARGPVTVTAGEVTVSLAIASDGSPEISCVKKGKLLAAIPAALKKNPEIAELSARKTDLRRSASRMRVSLEQAMVRGDVFSAEDLRDLSANPLLSPLLERLVFLGEGIAGYPVDQGRGLADCDGRIEPLKKGELLLLAHPHDLLGTNRWTDWQRDCFARERVQPFKQVFRELYVLTQTEKDAKVASRRYAGHQVQPRQGLALLGSRGWIASPEQGVFRTFHELGLTAWMTFLQPFFTPAEIEGLTVEEIRFTRKSADRDWTPLADIPPRVFSEVMRDVDLLVSVAHRGGVDPEASASTVQMRSSLLAETLQLLKIDNVRIQDSHALIQGRLAEYSLHLGSAVTHRLPGGALFLVPVHSQHRGRLFLPFADDDPKTAEVISKVLLLARDHQIKDPRLLSQIRGM